MTSLKQMSLMVLLALGLSATATAQQAAPGQQQGDQVDQLDRMVDLNDDQKQELREMIKDSEGKITEMRKEAQQLQQALSDQIGPDYDEGEIRDNAEELGELTGDVTAESVLLQARIQDTLTEEQRATLEKRAQQQREQMRQMQEQMRQQQGGQQGGR
ncbi:Spy/CpxP family protein refolding chaperone [Alloalcanivorax venustensis]|jgi:Spy/CpxP family protein refolding chaperone|uniref:Spy/CpxP family protein refolding chaperone n=1 Tax=Alloalcanivorax venustensis TaxID=172371 RepID=UPI00115CD7EB|nr:Heavy-metal resistance [Alcanivorax sp. DSM 26295]